MTRHSKIVVSFVGLIVAMGAAGRGTLSADESKTPVQGVWRTVEVVVPGAPGTAGQRFTPEATLAIFHGRHYSRVEVHADRPRKPLANASTATADEIRAVWGPFVGEAGTFELSASDTITMHATVAKDPAAMKDGAMSVYTYRRQGDRLTLTQVRTLNGPAANPIIVKLQRVE